MASGRIALPDLLAATGRKQRDLWDLRRRGLFPFEPEQVYVPGRPGSASSYPAEAVDYLQRLGEVRRQFQRNGEECFWQMWLDAADWPVDMQQWVLARLDGMLEKTARSKVEKDANKPGAEYELLGATTAGRVRNSKQRRELLDWTTAWARGDERPELYSATSESTSKLSYFDLVLKALGPPFEGWPVPRLGGRREHFLDLGGPYLLAKFQRIVALARDRDLRQARRDWRAICQLIEAAERVDWNKAPPLTAIGSKPEPPSWVARKARRRRRKPPPGFVKLLIDTWRTDFDARALVFSELLILRRLCWRSAMPNLPDVLIGIAQQWLDGLPQFAISPAGRRLSKPEAL